MDGIRAGEGGTECTGFHRRTGTEDNLAGVYPTEAGGSVGFGSWACFAGAWSDELRGIERILADEVEDTGCSPVLSGELSLTDSLLIGREKECEDLNRMVKSGRERVVQVIAAGGVGKTSLVGVWLQ